MLAGPVLAVVQRRLRSAPEIDAEAPVDLVLRLLALRHDASPCLCRPLRGRPIVPIGHPDQGPGRGRGDKSRAPRIPGTGKGEIRIRTEERSGGKEGVRTCQYRGAPDP